MTRALLLAVACAATLHAQSPPADTFKFRDAASRVVNVALDDANGALAMTWPGDTADWDTALLGVDVSSGLPTPFVEIAAAGRSDRQYFSQDDAGRRWINLSFLRGAVSAGTRVTVRAEGLRITAGPAPLRLFSNQLDLSAALLVLAPHPDDAEIAAFGVYAHRNATIVTVTTGNAGPPTYEAVFDNDVDLYQFKGRIRLIDSITVPWQGGIPPERTFNMGYFDARLAEMHDQPTAVIPERYGPNTDIGAYVKYNLGSLLPKRPRASTWRNLVDDLDTIVRKVKPKIILAPHPQLDSHADHQFTTVALGEVLARRRQRVTLLLYTNHADRNRYPYGPAGTIMSLPPPLAQDVPLDRVYSHPVPVDLQRRKLFALESMHDLRSSPSRLYQVEVGSDRLVEPEKQGPSSVGGVNYLRRALRSNELFFVHDETTLKPVIEAFLAARPPRATR
jgi:LmbE family N-acetylglucosaminyl deacetylase